MKNVLKALLVAGVVIFGTACGKADLGDSCDTAGATDECVDGGICDTSSGSKVCLKICTDQAQCGVTEDCNGVSGSTTKACHSKN